MEAIAVTFLPDKQSEFLQFLLGNIDFVSGIDPSYKDELLDKEGRLMDKYNEKVRLLRTSYLNTEYLGFNMNTPIPIALRRAINYGFDRKEMVKYLRNGIGVPAEQGFVPPVLLGQQIEGYSYQPEKAQSLINQYIADGKKLPEIRLATTPQYVDLCEYIQNAMSALSLDIKIDLMTPSTLRQMKAQTNCHF